jgi:transposase-like protein
VLVSKLRDTDAERPFFRFADHAESETTEVVTDAARVYLQVLDELVQAAWHHVGRYENNRVPADV